MCQLRKEIQFAIAGEFISVYVCHCWLRIEIYTNGLLPQVTGGGGYTKENVARCWTVETGVLLDTELPNGIFSQLLSSVEL